jgi:hypothetical protein
MDAPPDDLDHKTRGDDDVTLEISVNDRFFLINPKAVSPWLFTFHLQGLSVGGFFTMIVRWLRSLSGSLFVGLH